MSAAEHLAEIADYCRVDASDAQLPAFIAAAEGYMLTGVCAQPAQGTAREALYLLCIKHLVLDMYDRREATVDGTVSENPMFRRIINQLKLTESVPDSGTLSEEGGA